MLERPAHEREDGVRRGFGGHVRVGVQAVQGAHTGVAQIAEYVLGDQRRAQHDEQLCRDDDSRQRAQAQRARAGQHERVAGAQQQRQGLEATAAEREPQPVKRPRQPARPTAAARGDVLGGSARGACGEQEAAREQHEHRAAAKRPCGPRLALAARRAHGGWGGHIGTRGLAGREAGRRCRSLHQRIVASRRPSGVWCAR